MSDELQPDGSGFVHLHNHTENSQLDGLTRVSSVARTAAALGQKALALTDHGSLAAAWKFQKNCLAAGIKPIIGCEMYMAIGSRHERNFETVANDDDNISDADEGKEKSKRYMHLTVLARNEAGWKSLLALHNKAEDSHWSKPRIDFDLLDEHGDGLIILTGCLGGPVAGPLARAGAIDKAFEAARREISALLDEEDSEELAGRLVDDVVAYAALKQRLSESDGKAGPRQTSLIEAVKNFTPALAADAGDELRQDLTRITTKLPGIPADATRLRADARTNLDRLIGAVGREHVFLEVMHHGIKAETHAYREIRALSAETGIPMVATNDCHYEHAADAVAHDGFLAVGVKRSLDDPKRFKFNGTPDYYLKSEAEMLDVLGNLKNEEAAAAWRQAVANSVMVADLCADKVIPDPKMRLPRFPVPEGFDSERAYLHHLVKEGAVERYGRDPVTGERRPLPAEVRERLRTEEDIICDMGFPAYFLIVWDMIAWARSDYTPQDWVDLHAGRPVDDAVRTRKKPIAVGVGRGSAAGAATSYCLKIVGVDPLENNLLFERFLEPGRTGMPDIDVDFEAARRSEVFVFVGVRWGKDRVAHIGTFGMALSKAAVKDAARILKPSEPAPEVFAEAKAARAAGDPKKAAAITGDAYARIVRRAGDIQRLGNKLSDLIPSNGGKAYPFAQLDDLSDNSGEAFRSLVAESGSDAQDILALARAFEGVTKTESIHACGFIISPDPLDDIVPMRWQSHAAAADPNAPRVICWDGNDCEELGLLKMDILGLTNLDIASTALDYIAAGTGNTFTIEQIPHPNTPDNAIVRGAYQLMSQGRTGGVFQMESGGMIRTAQEVEPETLDDISAIVALFRPGPLKAGMHTSYARRKAGLEPVAYTDFTHDPVETEWIDTVLGGTYGMAIYQETIMRLSTVVAGFDAAQRSRLRKAMGKKKQSEMDACLTMWTEGAGAEFTDDDGNVISPVFAAATAQKLWDFISGAASYLFNACLTGESVLHGDRGARWTIEDLYFRLHGNDDATPGLCPNCNDRPSRPNTPMCTRCATWLYKFRDSRGFDLLAYDHSDGRIRPQRVKDVHQNGVRPVFSITLDDGKTVRATGNHRFLTPSGYVHVDDLVVGGELTINGGYEKQLSNYPERRTTTGARAAVAGNKPWLPGEKNTGFVDGGFVKLREWTELTVASAACDECGRTHADGRLERAHLDGNRTNNDPSNLAWKCPSHHKAYDYATNGRLARWQKGHRPDAARIVSIVPDGEEMVYDVEMEEGTDHNFVVNGIVSHNSHSAAYGMLAYYTAYLKAGWPVEYAAAILAVADKDEKRQTALTSLRADSIVVKAPDVNLSQTRTAPVSGAVHIGLGEVKGVGDAGQYVVAEREANGPFSGLADLLNRVRIPADTAAGFSRIPVTAVQGLIEAGALDSFGPRLGQVMVLRAARLTGIEPLDAEWSDVEKSTRQRSRLGTSLGVHPLNSLKEELKVWRAPGGGYVTPLHKIASGNGDSVQTVGVISAWEEKGYSGGRRANFALESSKLTLNGVMWDFTLSRLRRQGNVPKVGDVVAVSGKVNVRTTYIGDEESGTQESITTKELSINEVWPIDSGTKPEISLPATVIDFAAKYRQLRSAPPPEPEPRKKAPAAKEPDKEPAARQQEAPAREPEPSRLAPVVSIREHRERTGGDVVAVLVEEYESSMVGQVLFGNAAVLKAHTAEGIPGDSAAEAGVVYRCLPATGETIFMVTEGVPLAPDDAARYARDADESEWVPIRSDKSRHKYTWSRLATDLGALESGSELQRLAG